MHFLGYYYSGSHRKLTAACQTKAKRKKKHRYDWHNIYDWIQKSVGFGQFAEEKTTRIKGRTNTNTDQTNDIKHNGNFVLGDNCILIEFLIEGKRKKVSKVDKKSFFFFESTQSKILQFSKENRRNHTFIQYLN